MESQNECTKIYAHFKLVFTAAHLELRKSQAKTMDGDFQANFVLQQEETIQALANLATATPNDYDVMAILTATNQLRMEKLITAMDTTALLTKQLASKSNSSTSDETIEKRNMYY